MHRIVAVTPAGRRHYLQLLHRYISADPSIDEWHLWDNCRAQADRAYIEELARQDRKIRLIRIERTDGTNKSVNRFYRLAADPDTFYIKMDDDLVYLAPRLGEQLYRHAVSERDQAIWWSPLVINNAICSALLKYQSRLNISALLTAQAACPFGWRSPIFAQRLHETFLTALRTHQLAAFRIPNVSLAAARFSINCIGFFGQDVRTLGEEFCPLGVDDEEWISAVLPVRAGRVGRIIGDTTVAHFSFFPQEAGLLATPVLSQYYQHMQAPMPAVVPPRVRLKDRALRYFLLRGLGALDIGQIELPAVLQPTSTPEGANSDGIALKNSQA